MANKRRRLSTHSTGAKVGRSRIDLRLEVSENGEVQTNACAVATRSAVSMAKKTVGGPATRTRSAYRVTVASASLTSNSVSKGVRNMRTTVRKRPTRRYRPTVTQPSKNRGESTPIADCILGTTENPSCGENMALNGSKKSDETGTKCNDEKPTTQEVGEEETTPPSSSAAGFEDLESKVTTGEKVKSFRTKRVQATRRRELKRNSTTAESELESAPPAQVPKLNSGSKVHSSKPPQLINEGKADLFSIHHPDFLQNLKKALSQLGCDMDLESGIKRKKMDELNKPASSRPVHRQLRRSASIEECERENMILNLIKTNKKILPTTAGIAEMYESLLGNSKDTDERQVKAPKVKKDADVKNVKAVDCGNENSKAVSKKPIYEGAGAADRIRIDDDLRRVEETRAWIRSRVSKGKRDSAARLTGDHVEIHSKQVENIVRDQFGNYVKSTIFGSLPSENFTAILRQVIISDCIERNTAAEAARRARTRARNAKPKANSEELRLKVDESNLDGVHVFNHHSIQEVGQGVLYQMRRKEQHHRPNRNLLRFHDALTNRMRAILLDWMMEVGQEFGLRRMILHKAFYFVDRYLSKTQQVSVNRIQLVGVTAILIASKVEEQTPPRVVSLAKATDGAYEPQEIIEMEGKMIEVFEWKLTPITVYSWAEWYLQAISIRKGELHVNPEAEKTSDGFTDQGNFTPDRPPQSGVNHRKAFERFDKRLKSGHGGSNQSSTWAAPRNKVDSSIVNRYFAIIDAAMLDVDCLYFLPSMVAASALLIATENHRLVEEVTMYSIAELYHCKRWIDWVSQVPWISSPVERLLRSTNFMGLVPNAELHTFQLHNVAALHCYKATHPKNAPPHPACVEFSVQSRADWSSSTMATLQGSAIERTAYLSPMPLGNPLGVSPTGHSPALAKGICSSAPGSAALSTTTTQLTDDGFDLEDTPTLETNEELE